MITPEQPENEEQRQQAVERYKILDTLPEGSFDDITELMSHISGAPISLITMIDNDRNYLKSHHGVPFSESPRAISFCGHAINQPEKIMLVEDAREDERFADNPLVSEHNAIFYAGVPLVTPDGFKLGTLCLFDNKPRQLSEETIAALIKMARQVELLLDLRLKNEILNSTKNQLEKHNLELSEFARSISHDIKSPLTNLLYLTDAVLEDHNCDQPNEQFVILEKIKASAMTLSGYTDRLLDYYLTSEANRDALEKTNINSVFNEIKLLCPSERNIKIDYSSSCESMLTNRASLSQILLNLVTNAIKYTDKEHTHIQIACRAHGTHVEFTVEDNGMGIPLKQLDAIFNLFETGKNVDRYGDAGTGIGLSTVKLLVENMGGAISASSRIGIGSTFTFTLPNAQDRCTPSAQAA